MTVVLDSGGACSVSSGESYVIALGSADEVVASECGECSADVCSRDAKVS